MVDKRYILYDSPDTLSDMTKKLSKTNESEELVSTDQSQATGRMSRLFFLRPKNVSFFKSRSFSF